MINTGWSELFGNPALSVLTDRARSKLLDTCQQVLVPSGRKLYEQGGDPPGIYFVLTGFVKLTRTDRDGHQLLMRLTSRGEAFGMCCNPFDTAPATCTATAQTDVGLAHLPALRFRQLASDEPTIVQPFIGLLSATRRGCVDLATQMAFQPIESRIAGLLIHLARWAVPQEGATEIPNLLNQEEMAHAVGTAREVVTRALGRFQDAGLIGRRGRRILILDPAGLAAASAAAP